ncbi:hypothetical protein C8F04DRAFT_1341641 [Mycena alexandri]|uniref:Uncharacterized protein n=1 Tax=Mycena alexandri TaxID=1745969 RepID=A0AAD6X3W2_9AGAR|nr:hypothetical protein C8F04DRAFT_1341641 [Mycena alexandri]
MPTPPSTPLGYKRRRIDVPLAPNLPPLDATGLISMDDLEIDSAVNSSQNTPPPPLLSSPEHIQKSMRVLDASTHAVRLSVTAQEQSEKGTEPVYRRHYSNYQTWFQMDQGTRNAQDSTWKEVPALPITATKVSLFLEYETSREKKKRNSSETHNGTTIGKSGILQAISALEWFRENHQHEYPNDPETRIKLRDDICIQAFESAAKHNEPKRAESAQAQKAAGTSVD